MVLIENPSTHFPEIEVALRLILACIFGAVVGFERELKQRAAGLRTHMLVALASALFTVVAFEIFYAVRSMDNVANIDPIRLVEAITAGVAFLAAGSIIHGSGKIRGLTTGAGLWMAGALGMASGAGYYAIAFMGTILTLIILVIIHTLEGWLGTEDAPAERNNH